MPTSMSGVRVVSQSRVIKVTTKITKIVFCNGQIKESEETKTTQL